jgi:thiol-disulfide isomerase/thioredoxin
METSKRKICLAFALVLLLGFDAQADVREDIAKISTSLRANNLDEAIATFKQSLSENPDNESLRGQTSLLWSYLSRAERNDEAADLVAEQLKWAMENEKFNHVSLAVSRLGRSRQLQDRAEEFQKTLVGYNVQLSKVGSIQAIPAWEAVAIALAQQYLAAEEGEQAKAIFRPVVERARQLASEDEASDKHLSMLSSVVATFATLHSDEAAGRDLRTESLSLLRGGIEQRIKGWEGLVRQYSSRLQSQFSVLQTAEEFDDVAGMLAELKTAVDSLAEKSRLKPTLLRDVSNIQTRYASARQHFDLVGQPAFPLDAISWVNGEELTTEALSGKVVLLDFWAVWCGPCIATFPHLREWQEKYGDKGLVIIGMTRYYEYGWNKETNRPQKTTGISPDDEEAAMLEFAAHHDLTHRFALMPPGSPFSKQYGVRGIPQAVLIDAEGKIRLIKVGSGEANAKAIDTVLKELFGDKS